MKRVRPMPIKAGLLISLDGPVAGSEQSLEHPIGVSGMGLNDWIGGTAKWRRVGGGEVAGQDRADSDLLGREVRALLHGSGRGA